MKKFGFAIVALLTLSLFFVSCSGGAGMEVLEASDVTSSWATGTWSGTQTTITKLGSADAVEETLELTGEPLTATTLIGFIEADGSGVVIAGTGVKIKTVAKANHKRNKLYTEIETTSYLADEVVSVVTVKSNMTKD